MPGKRGKNLRQGDLAEGLGIEALRGIAVVAPVPRTEDIGIDAVCTLLRESTGFYFAEDSFNVQIKSASCRSIEFIGDEYEWLRGLRTALFFQSVCLTSMKISIYSFDRACDHLSNTQTGVVAHLDPVDGDDGDDYDHGPIFRDNVHHVCLGDPILTYSIANSNSNEFRLMAYPLLKSWIQIHERNIILQPYGQRHIPKWQTNKMPGQSHSRYSSGMDEKTMREFQARQAAMILSVRPNLSHEDRDIILRSLEVYLKHGAPRSIELDVAIALLKTPGE